MVQVSDGAQQLKQTEAKYKKKLLDQKDEFEEQLLTLNNNVAKLTKQCEKLTATVAELEATLEAERQSRRELEEQITDGVNAR